MTALVERSTAPAGSPVPEAPQPVGGTGRGLLSGASSRTAGLLGAGVLLGAAAVASVAYGSRPIPVGRVVDALVAFDGASNDHVIVRSLRVPRTMLGLSVGASLGLAGAIMQGLTRNPLADPGILGVSAGAALAVVVGIALGVTTLPASVWLAFAGAAAAGALVYGLGSVGRGGATPVKLALAGAAVTALLGSLTSGVLLVDVATLDQFRFWVVGSLAGRDVGVAVQVGPFLAAGAVLALASARSLNALALGDDVARSLGQRVGLARGVGALAVVLLTGAAVAACGPIGFVGLTVPHVARALVGPDYRWILPASAVLAPTLLLIADVAGRVVARPGELQVGIVTAALGAPFFVALVRRRRLAEL